VITLWLLAIELPIIVGGAVLAGWVAIDHQGRAAARHQELADIDAWLNLIRATPTRGRR
jgi:hypothetical protein